MVWDALLLDMKVLTFFMGKAVSSNNLTYKQNSGLVNFILGSHLPLAQISSIYWKMAVKAWNWCH